MENETLGRKKMHKYFLQTASANKYKRYIRVDQEGLRHAFCTTVSIYPNGELTLKRNVYLSKSSLIGDGSETGTINLFAKEITAEDFRKGIIDFINVVEEMGKED